MNDEKAASGRVRHPQRVYLDRIRQIVEPQTRWLDIGCGRQLTPSWIKGHQELEAEMTSQAKWLIGVDPDFAALRDNRSCQLRLNADATALPFADASFDLVTSNMVFEHIEHPRLTLAEIRRVLKIGGRFIVLTPNWLDIVTIAARAVPNRFHPAIVSRIELRGREDVYPTHFRFNRPRTVEKLMREAGFNRWRIELLDQPDSYSHVPIVAALENVWHGMARRWPALRGALLIEARAAELSSRPAN